MFRQTALFNGRYASGKDGLWETNGTAAGTYKLTGIVDGVFNPSDFTAFNGAVLFAGEDANTLYGLWMTNGTAAGTHELTSTLGSLGVFGHGMTVFNGEVLFEGEDASGK
jgi:ELWxxDGT repeat protein